MFSIERLDVIDIAYRFKITEFPGNYAEKIKKSKKIPMYTTLVLYWL